MSTATLEPVQRLIADEMHAVDEVIRRRLHSDVVLVRQVSRVHHQRRRQAAAACAGDPGGRCMRLQRDGPVSARCRRGIHPHGHAAARRCGRRVASCAAGGPPPIPCSAIAASVLVGDFLYSRAFQMMVELDEHARHAGAGRRHQHDRRGRGPAAAQLPRRRPSTSRTICTSSATRPPSCSRPPASSAPSSARPVRRWRQGLARYGMHLGTAFQLIDDVLDYSGDHAETGKNLGDDLAEGKPTLPLIYAMRHGTPEQAAVIRSAIEHGGLEEFAAGARRDPGYRSARLHAPPGRSANPTARWTRCERCRIRLTGTVCYNWRPLRFPAPTDRRPNACSACRPEFSRRAARNAQSSCRIGV